MKMIYITPHGAYSTPTGTEKGVENKILQQIGNLEKIGVEIDRIDIGLSMNGLISGVKSWRGASQSIRNALFSEDVDVIYIRQLFPYFVYALLIGKKHHSKVIFELQDIESVANKVTLDNSFLKNIRSLYLKLADLLFGKYIKSHADGLVSVTSEITTYNCRLTHNCVRCITLGNGIAVSSLPVRKFTLSNNLDLHILVVANVSYWHGIDRFIVGMKEYKGLRSIILHIVGSGYALPNLESLTDSLELSDHVIFHGFKSGTDLDAMFDLCHIAIGSLAGFRANLQELSSLKSREYCARGIPFLMASNDADFTENWEYIQMVPATEDPIDMNTVISFADRVMADPDHPQKMHEYAKDHLDWLAKMKVLKEFLETL